MAQPQNEIDSLQTIADYVAALAAGDHRRMDELRAAVFVLDFVHGDGYFFNSSIIFRLS